MATEYGVTPEGYVRKRLPEILDDVINRFEDRLGVKIIRNSTNVAYQMFATSCYELSDIHAQLQNIYNAMYPNTATGVSLTNAAALTAIVPIAAEPTTVILSCTGIDGTLITALSQVQDANNNTYSCDTDTYIQKSSASSIQITVSSIIIGTTYTMTIDGISKSYTAIAGDTISSVLTSLYSQFTFTDRSFDVNNNILTVSMNDMSNVMAITVNNLVVSKVTSPVDFTCDVKGDISPDIGDIVTIITSISGWESVYNDVAANVGRNDETDEELRLRWVQSVYKKASAMLQAIVANVYENVTGVTACSGYENESDIVDSDGRPPHSIEIVVSGGDDNKIAQEIYNYKAGGISTFGSVSETVNDFQGIPHIINFNRPIPVKIWIKAVITKNEEEVWGDNTLNEVAEQILADGETYTVGKDVIVQRFLQNIYKNTTGIGKIDLKATTGETPGTYSEDNIVIAAREVAAFDASRIEVSLV